MNIFKVLASAKKGFQEEYATAILAWLMNPNMEHGLGFTFLGKFIEQLAGRNSKLNNLTERLSSKFRVEYEKQLQWSCFLEYSVEIAFIDAVFILDDWIFSIENKIRSESASNIEQLPLQYEGLRRKIGKEGNNYKVAIVFLVPVSQDGTLSPNIEEAYGRLNLADAIDDFKCLYTWQKNEGGYPSVSAIIESLLSDDAIGRIDPISEYTRHTLKALNQFIMNDFNGYEYERSGSYSGINPLTEARFRVADLWKICEGYVGVQNGVGGLLKRMTIDQIQSHSFQYTKADMSNRPGWLTIDVFNKITRWIITGEVVDIGWAGKYYSDVLYKIAKGFKDRVFIGIKGGEKALRSMSNHKIANKQWQIDQKGPTNSWIRGSTFAKIIEEKGVYPEVL